MGRFWGGIKERGPDVAVAGAANGALDRRLNEIKTLVEGLGFDPAAVYAQYRAGLMADHAGATYPSFLDSQRDPDLAPLVRSLGQLGLDPDQFIRWIFMGKAVDEVMVRYRAQQNLSEIDAEPVVETPRDSGEKKGGGNRYRNLAKRFLVPFFWYGIAPAAVAFFLGLLFGSPL